MKIHNEFQQNSLEWLNARAGVVTASEFDNLLTPKFAIKEGKAVKSYLAQKVAEKWLGGPLPSFNSIDMDFGKILEEEALPTYTLMTGQAIERVAFITRDDGRVGCSPDGLIGERAGIEVKCPRPDTHTKYLLAGVLPEDYAVQVHGSMFVTGRPEWVFCSYSRHFPLFTLTIKRDEEIIGQIEKATEDFLVLLDSAMKRIEEINGGPPSRLSRVLKDLKGDGDGKALGALVGNVEKQQEDVELMKAFNLDLVP